MSKYLLTAGYASDSIKGLLENGGTPRRANASRTIESLGGTVDSFYYATTPDGGIDVVVICDLPDAQAAAALFMWFNSSGRVTGKLTPLLTVDDIDAVSALKGADSAARTAPAAAPAS